MMLVPTWFVDQLSRELGGWGRGRSAICQNPPQGPGDKQFQQVHPKQMDKPGPSGKVESSALPTVVNLPLHGFLEQSL